MNFFEGNVAEAVQLSKEKGAVFLVFIHGKSDDPETIKLSSFLDSAAPHLTSDQFVALRIEGDTETYRQFAQIYRLVPIPSIFFIGKQGQPIEIVTQVTDSVEQLVEKIKKVKEVVFGAADTKKNESSANANEGPSSSSSNVVCTDGVCTIRPASSNPAPAPASPVKTIEEKVDHAKKLIEKKRVEKEEEEKKKEKEQEIERRRTGKEVANLKKWQEDQELKQLQEDRKREKMEEEEARRRVLEKIKMDRMERQQKLNPNTSAQAEDKSNKVQTSNPKPQVAGDNSRIQFKKPDGESVVSNFKNTTTMSEIRSYVRESVVGQESGIKDFALATTFPRIEFKSEHDAKTLMDLELVPSAVILVIPLVSSSGPVIPRSATGAISGAGGFIYTVFMAVLAPLLALWNYFKNYFSGADRPASSADIGAQKRASEEQLSHNDIAKRRNLARFNLGPDYVDPNQPSSSKSNNPSSSSASGPYKRVGNSNIHRLQDKRDDDEDNNTWNGNSTQQM